MRTIGVTAGFFKKILTILKRFSIEKWGFSFISMFLILLLASAVLVATGNAVADTTAKLAYFSVADMTAIVAYFSLLVGVILEIVCFSRNRKKPGASSNPQR